MKILNSKLRNFNKKLDDLLLRRKTKVQASSVSVIKIINDVKKNGDIALLKYEKKFNQNSVIKPSFSQIKKSKFESKSIKADDLSILLVEIPGPVYEISYNSKTSLLQFCKLIAPLCLFNQSLF